MNRSGTVAFVGRSAGTEQAIFVGDGKSLAPIIETGPVFKSLFSIAISDRGAVAFVANLPSGECGVYRWSSGAIDTIAQDTQGCVEHLSINKNGLVAFAAGLRQQGRASALFVGNGDALAELVSPEDGFDGVDHPEINDSGVVVFRGHRFGFQGIFITDKVRSRRLHSHPDISLTTIADTLGQICSLGYPHLNNKGKVAIDVFLTPMCTEDDTALEALFVYDSGTLEEWARSGIDYTTIGGATAINDRGQVTLLAGSLTGEVGTFLQTRDTIKLVVARGDVIEGRRLQTIPVALSLNNRGQSIFVGQFDDGRHRLYRVERKR